MEIKLPFLEEKRGIEPISENEYFDIAPLLLEYKHYPSEDNLISSELKRMEKCMSVLVQNKENRTRQESVAIVDRMDVYKKFLKNRQDYLKTKQKSDMVFEALFDEEGNLKKSDTDDVPNSWNAVQKVLLLDQLGLIDVLHNNKSVGTSINAMASLIAIITDEKKSTIQPYLNQLLSEGATAENKNPYSSKSSVEKVRNLLLTYGIQPKKL